MSSNIGITDLKVSSCAYKWNIKKFSVFVRMAKKNKSTSSTLATSPSFRIQNHNNVEFNLSIIFDQIKLKHETKLECAVLLHRHYLKEDDNCPDNYGEMKCSVIKYNGEKYLANMQYHNFSGKYDEVFTTDSFNIATLLREANINAFNDELIIECNIDLFSSPVLYSKNNYVLKINSNICTDFEKLFNKREFADMTFILNNERIKAHKTILIARSEVFSAMFSHEMKEQSKNEAIINDISAEVFEKMLEYIYTDKVTNLDALASELLYAADKYALEGLKEQCGMSLWKKINVNNAADILVLAYRHNIIELLEFTQNFIHNHIVDIMKTPCGLTMMQEYPELLTMMCKFSAMKL
ncbi:hypothetical protein PV327_009805 [Microctonus hyperodae]|uniref:BTB domain-containing protein n=1 Tax=Microctonus hyperodae TaxID=165561 RepID=A0AA39F1R6_MICHY|nr:hypothetical protein PV327_009805 [Microctonus hyperodae]